MDKTIALHKEDMNYVVGPRVGWERLNEEVGNNVFFFPLDPGPGAMTGGMCTVHDSITCGYELCAYCD